MIPHNPDPDPDPQAGPVVVRVANCASVSAGDRKSSSIYKTALTKAGPFGVPQVVLGCEGSDFDAHRLAPDGWAAIQFAHDVAKAGSFIAWRDGGIVVAPELIVGSDAGEGIRTRYVVQAWVAANGRTVRFTSGHAPPDRAPNAQAEWLRKVDDWPGVVGADFNTHGPTLAKRFDRQVRAVEVLALLVPNHIPCSRAAAVDIGSDHPAVDVVLWPTNKE